MLNMNAFAATNDNTAQFAKFGGLSYNYESNVFNSPEAVGLQTGLVKSDSFLLYNAGFNINGHWDKANLYKVRYEYVGTNFSNYSVLNDSIQKVNFSYTHKFNKSWELNTGAIIKRKDRNDIDIFGVPFSTDYSYQKLSYGADLSYRINPDKGNFNEKLGRTDIKLSYWQDDKNYGTSLYDYAMGTIGLRLKQKLGKNFQLGIGYDHSTQNYDNELAKTSGGVDNSSGILREQTYQIATWGFDWNITKHAALGFDYSNKTRRDPYAGYYSYDANIYALGFGYNFSKNTKLSLKAKYEPRAYKLYGTPPLTEDYLDLSCDFTHKFSSNFTFFTQFSMNNRDTNATDTAATTDLSYLDSSISSGVRISF